MKKCFLMMISFAILSDAFAFSVNRNPIKQAGEIYLHAGPNGEKISLLTLSEISIKDYQRVTGKHLNFFERMNFKAAQKKVRNNITPQGTMTYQFTQKYADGEGLFSDFNLGGFALGLILFLPGVLIAYLIGGDEDVKKSRIRWAWRGAAIFATVALALFKNFQ